MAMTEYNQNSDKNKKSEEKFGSFRQSDYFCSRKKTKRMMTTPTLQNRALCCCANRLISGTNGV